MGRIHSYKHLQQLHNHIRINNLSNTPTLIAGDLNFDGKIHAEHFQRELRFGQICATLGAIDMAIAFNESPTWIGPGARGFKRPLVLIVL